MEPPRPGPDDDPAIIAAKRDDPVLRAALDELEQAETHYEAETFRAFPGGYVVLSKSARDVLVAALAGRPEAKLELRNRDTPEGRDFWDYIDKCVVDWEKQRPEWTRKQAAPRPDAETPATPVQPIELVPAKAGHRIVLDSLSPFQWHYEPVEPAAASSSGAGTCATCRWVSTTTRTNGDTEYFCRHPSEANPLHWQEVRDAFGCTLHEPAPPTSTPAPTTER